MTIDEDAGALSATYDVRCLPTREAGEPSGTLEGTRIEVEPATP
jgi:hypothetical protein